MTTSARGTEADAPGPEVETVVCAGCGARYRHDMNILTGEYLWFKPKNTRACKHPFVLVNGEHRAPAV